MQAKFAKGPVAMIAVFPNGMPPMGKLMVQQILFFILGCFFIAYIASLAMPAGADYMQVFRIVSAVAFLTFGWGTIPFSIWYGHPWSTTAWLWPAIS